MYTQVVTIQSAVGKKYKDSETFIADALNELKNIDFSYEDETFLHYRLDPGVIELKENDTIIRTRVIKDKETLDHSIEIYKRLSCALDQKGNWKLSVDVKKD